MEPTVPELTALAVEFEAKPLQVSAYPTLRNQHVY
jgi:hypothetical protein